MFRAGDYGGALALADQALAQLKSDPVLHEFRALTLFALKRYDEAAAVNYAVLSAGPSWNWATMINLYPSVEVYTAQLPAPSNSTRRAKARTRRRPAVLARPISTWFKTPKKPPRRGLLGSPRSSPRTPSPRSSPRPLLTRVRSRNWFNEALTAARPLRSAPATAASTPAASRPFATSSRPFTSRRDGRNLARHARREGQDLSRPSTRRRLLLGRHSKRPHRDNPGSRWLQGRRARLEPGARAPLDGQGRVRRRQEELLVQAPPAPRTTSRGSHSRASRVDISQRVAAFARRHNSNPHPANLLGPIVRASP